MDNSYVTMKEAAELAGVHRETVRRAVRAGKIVPYQGANRKAILLLRKDVEAWAKPKPVAK